MKTILFCDTLHIPLLFDNNFCFLPALMTSKAKAVSLEVRYWFENRINDFTTLKYYGGFSCTWVVEYNWTDDWIFTRKKKLNHVSKWIQINAPILEIGRNFITGMTNWQKVLSFSEIACHQPTNGCDFVYDVLHWNAQAVECPDAASRFEQSCN